MEKNYNETNNKYNYLLKNDDTIYKDKFYLYYIYIIKKQRRINNKSIKDNIK